MLRRRSACLRMCSSVLASWVMVVSVRCSQSLIIDSSCFRTTGILFCALSPMCSIYLFLGFHLWFLCSSFKHATQIGLLHASQKLSSKNSTCLLHELILAIVLWLLGTGSSDSTSFFCTGVCGAQTQPLFVLVPLMVCDGAVLTEQLMTCLKYISSGPE